MKPSDLDAQRQVLRLGALPRFAELGDGGIAELTQALRDTCRDREHAELTITAWLEASAWLPSSDDLVRFAARIEPREGGYTSSRRCELCGNTGYRPVIVLTTYKVHPSGDRRQAEQQIITQENAAVLRKKVDGWGQRVDEAVAHCSCGRGRGIVNAARELEAEAEARKHRRQEREVKR